MDALYQLSSTLEQAHVFASVTDTDLICISADPRSYWLSESYAALLRLASARAPCGFVLEFRIATIQSLTLSECPARSPKA